MERVNTKHLAQCMALSSLHQILLFLLLVDHREGATLKADVAPASKDCRMRFGVLQVLESGCQLQAAVLPCYWNFAF